MCGWRDGVVGKVAEDYKYQSVRGAGLVLAEILDQKLPVILGETVVVPLPTIRSHVRQRGLDHTLMVAREFARRREFKCEQLLVRRANTVQVGSTATERKQRAAKAYALRAGMKVQAETTYLLYDDVWTTGASMLAANEVLREAGAEKVMMAVMAVSRSREEIEAEKKAAAESAAAMRIC